VDVFADAVTLGVFEDLENYVREPRDGGVFINATHERIGKNDVEVEIEARQLKLQKEGHVQLKDEL